jgi:hypothetical protein
MRVLLLIFVALIAGVGLGYFGPSLVFAASDLTELTFPAPDLDPKFVKRPTPGQSFGCDPIAAGNVFDDRLKHRATAWTNYSASKVAIQISGDGKQLLLARATDVSAGVAQPEEFTITLNGTNYLTAEERLTLGVASVIFDVRTMKMVWFLQRSRNAGDEGRDGAVPVPLNGGRSRRQTASDHVRPISERRHRGRILSAFCNDVRRL